jgi:hypothetical protein
MLHFFSLIIRYLSYTFILTHVNYYFTIYILKYQTKVVIFIFTFAVYWFIIIQSYIKINFRQIHSLIILIEGFT